MPDKPITTDTGCRKCGAAMPPIKPLAHGPFAGFTMTITGYACEKCGHWNNLKRRKPKTP
jgi:hypothetical protein